jgi:hypothetical protein
MARTFSPMVAEFPTNQGEGPPLIMPYDRLRHDEYHHYDQLHRCPVCLRGTPLVGMPNKYHTCMHCDAFLFPDETAQDEVPAVTPDTVRQLLRSVERQLSGDRTPEVRDLEFWMCYDVISLAIEMLDEIPDN